MPAERILLIGGNGFIGRALARRLADMGRTVHVLSRHVEPGRRDGIAFHRACQSEEAVVGPLLANCGALVHLASTTTPGRSARAPALETVENLLPLARLLEMLAQAGPRRLVFLSSGGAIYGNPPRLPAREDMPAAPLSWHATGKLAAEAMFATAARQHGSALAILRPGNVYGPGQGFQAGFGFVRTLLECARAGRPVEIWGDGSQVRDYLYIDDLVGACVGLLDVPAAQGVFNAGTGIGTSLLELTDLARRVTGRPITANFLPGRGIDVARIWLDCRRLHAATGWQAQTGLEEGLVRTWAWVNTLRPW